MVQIEISKIIYKGVEYISIDYALMLVGITFLVLIITILYCSWVYLYAKNSLYKKFINQKELSNEYQKWYDERKRG
jgi:hypothetical protein